MTWFDSIEKRLAEIEAEIQRLKKNEDIMGDIPLLVSQSETQEPKPVKRKATPRKRVVKTGKVEAPEKNLS